MMKLPLPDVTYATLHTGLYAGNPCLHCVGFLQEGLEAALKGFRGLLTAASQCMCVHNPLKGCTNDE